MIVAVRAAWKAINSKRSVLAGTAIPHQLDDRLTGSRHRVEMGGVTTPEVLRVTRKGRSKDGRSSRLSVFLLKGTSGGPSVWPVRCERLYQPSKRVRDRCRSVSVLGTYCLRVARDDTRYRVGDCSGIQRSE